MLTHQIPRRIIYIVQYVTLDGDNMQTKLTLRLEKTLIEGAKEWAEKNDISLSQIVAMFFKRLLPHKEEMGNFHPFTRKMLGIAKKKNKKSPTDSEIRESYISYLEEKYK